MKGLPYLFEAVKILKSRGYDCDLVLISYNPKEDVLTEARSFGIENKFLWQGIIINKLKPPVQLRVII